MENIMTDKKTQKLIEQFESLGITTASKATKFGFLDTPFASINSLIGGLPVGRFTTIAGPEHTGKGAFCAQVIAHLQSRDPDFICLWTDAENAFDANWFERLGVDLDRVYLQRYTPDVNSMERLMDQALSLLKATEINMWVVDSIGALLPSKDGYEIKNKKVSDKSFEGTNMLNLQRKLGEFYRKANIYIAPRPKEGYSGCATLMIGQIYTVPSAHASISEVKGGNAVKHWAHLRLMFRRGPRADWPDETEIVSPSGNKIKVRPGWSGRIKVEKTRINANESKEVLLPFVHGKGFDSMSSTIYSALGLDIIKRSGAFYKHSSLPDGQMKGKDNTIEYFVTNKEAYSTLHEEVMTSSLEFIPSEDVIKTTEEDQPIDS
jgi:recombination protein RecA